MRRLNLHQFKTVLAFALRLAMCTGVSASAQEESEDSTISWVPNAEDDPRQVSDSRPYIDRYATILARRISAAGKSPAVRRPRTRRIRRQSSTRCPASPSKDKALKALQGVSSNHRIVLYCSVGHRSSDLAQFLMKKGYTEIYNLEGSIFAWANEGRPVYRGKEQVQVVHPYDKTWGRLLKESLRKQ